MVGGGSAVFSSTSAFRGNMRMRSFFNKKQTTPHYLRESPHNSAKVTKIIDTSANKGEDRLTTMGDEAESASNSNGPKAQPGGFLMFQTLDYE